MRTYAEVKSVDASGRCTVWVRRSSACSGSCASCGGCAGGAVTASAENLCGARVGEIVEVEGDTKKLLGGAAVLYLIPALLGIALMLVGYASFGEVGAGVGLAAGLGLGIGGAAIVSRRRKTRNMLRAVRVITSYDQL